MSTPSNSNPSSPTTSPTSPSLEPTTSPTTPPPPSIITSTTTTTTPSSPTTPPPPSIITSTTTTTTPSSPTKAQAALESLISILPTTSITTHSPTSASPPAFLRLTSPEICSEISTLLRHPSSGSGDNHLCRWLYETFHSSDPSLQLITLRFIPLISGLYLTRVTRHNHNHHRQPLAGFEAILLALYAHETTARDNHPITVTIPDLSHPSIYHESTSPQRNNSTDLNIAVVSPSLEPHGTVRSTRRARIVGVALELFFTKIWLMPLESKLDFCHFLQQWSGSSSSSSSSSSHHDDGDDDDDDDDDDEGTILLPWELLGPCMRILGHCLLGINNENNNNNNNNNNELLGLHEKAIRACKSLYNRAMHDVNPKAILAAGGLLRLVNMDKDCLLDDIDYTEIPTNRVISI